jgi:hypothetical protein
MMSVVAPFAAMARSRRQIAVSEVVPPSARPGVRYTTTRAAR